MISMKKLASGVRVGARTSAQCVRRVVWIIVKAPINAPIFARRTAMRVGIANARALVKDCEFEAGRLVRESDIRHERLGRRQFNKVRTMEIDGRMILAMDKMKKAQQSLSEKSEKLLSTSYK